MKPVTKLLVCCTVLTVCLVHLRMADAWCKCLRKPASDRGIAVYSPVECPDPCPTPPVGGRYVYTPYYPGYVPDRRCLMIYGTSMSNGYDGGGNFANIPAPYARSDYGAFTGANQDEAHLLRLGGQGVSRTSSYNPSQTGDIIDRIQGLR